MDQTPFESVRRLAEGDMTYVESVVLPNRRKSWKYAMKNAPNASAKLNA
jgi:hypothetical protein